MNPEPDPASSLGVPSFSSAAPGQKIDLASTETAPTVLWLIRHGEVEERYHHVFGGRIDMGLSARGHDQSRAMSNYLHSRSIDVLYASPMKRVHQTLASFLGNGAPKAVVLPDLREVDFGDWTGLHWNEVQAKYGISAFEWLDQLECAGIPNAECAQTLKARVEPCLRQILRQHPGQQVAIACHGGVIRMILSILLEWPLRRMACFEIDYASLTQVSWTPARTRLQMVNFVPWRAS